MASVTVYRFRLELSDVDRGVYESLDFRTALHPSETPIYLVTRVLAYALNAQEGLAFSPSGLSDPDAPAMRVDDAQGGGTRLWVEIGNPSARKLHKAAKAADQVKVYTYKQPELLLKDIAAGEVHRASELGIVSFDPRFLERLAASLQKDNSWGVMMSDGVLLVTRPDGTSEETEPRTHQA
jgi:uncharacterized protein YaeQ